MTRSRRWPGARHGQPPGEDVYRVRLGGWRGPEEVTAAGATDSWFTGVYGPYATVDVATMQLDVEIERWKDRGRTSVTGEVEVLRGPWVTLVTREESE